MLITPLSASKQTQQTHAHTHTHKDYADHARNVRGRQKMETLWARTHTTERGDLKTRGARTQKLFLVLK